MSEDEKEKKTEESSETPPENTDAKPENSEEVTEQSYEEGNPEASEGDLKPLKEMYSSPEEGGRACIIYGRDLIMNKQVVSLIKGLGITPVVMPVRGDQTKSVSVFLNEYPDVTFSIIILSADDWVYPKDGKPGEAKMYADQRAVFHLGFWVGHLGRSRVFVLYYDQRSFRWPTEHFDVIYTPLDRDGLWKKELCERLKAAGITFSDREL